MIPPKTSITRIHEKLINQSSKSRYRFQDYFLSVLYHSYTYIQRKYPVKTIQRQTQGVCIHAAVRDFLRRPARNFTQTSRRAAPKNERGHKGEALLSADEEAIT